MTFRSFFVTAHDPVLVAVERLKAKASDQLPSVRPETTVTLSKGKPKVQQNQQVPTHTPTLTLKGEGVFG